MSRSIDDIDTDLSESRELLEELDRLNKLKFVRLITVGSTIMLITVAVTVIVKLYTR